ncbi:MAG: tRNA uridine-5-carboxymethylaminomethyl(34) synthesis GTPase MnmE [Prevotellaceae bacterium]|nr:tRNA uridine-5-carboxymethylaminomethyl(34) synthesis GTPase MnmE [Prevotellaceae bacterium]
MPSSEALNSSDTICAIATPSGGALGVVRLSGAKAISIANTLFSQDLTQAQGHSLHYGRVTDPSTGETVDEVMVSVFRSPRSYTGEDCVELSCHGSPYVLQTVLRLLLDLGARLARAGEFTQRAFLNGKLDLTQAEAVADLIASETRAQHRMAMSQLRGGFSRSLQELRSQLLRLTSLLELELDFSDQDLEFAPRSQLSSLCLEAEQRVQSLVSSFRDGNALREGVPVAIVGAPNVGKSTLLNALLQDDRAIVSPVEGTTRDTVEDTLVIGGTLFRIVDTAGIRHAKDSLERLGIERSLKAAARARIILIVTEPGVPEPVIPTTPGQTVIHILNKTPSFQAINGTGLKELKEQLLASAPQPTEGQTVVSNLRHYEALRLALSDLQRVRKALGEGTSAELVAEDLRLCLHHLGEITGEEVTSDEVLSNIFSHFCVGK